MPRDATDRLSDVVDLMLDRGLVVDFYSRAVLTDLEFVSGDGRVVMASFDSYLHFADAVGHLGPSPISGRPSVQRRPPGA